MKINKKSLLYGTMILSAANLIVRLLGFGYRVFLSRMIGPQGMGIVQLVFPVFQIAVTLTAAGIPVAVSRMVAENRAKNNVRGMHKTVATAVTLVIAVSLTLALTALLNLDFIAQVIIKDERTKGALFIIFPCVTIIGLGASLKGYFYGQKNIHPPAIAEVVEQLVRMTVAITLIYLLAPGNNYSLAASLVMLGTIFGELASLLFLHINYHKSKKTLKYAVKQPLQKTRENYLKTLLSIAVPITSTRLVNSLMAAANSIMIPQRLMAGGLLKEEAVGLFGILSGMVMPLLFLPFTITNALSVIIIPNLSENLALSNWRAINDKISKAIRLTCMIAFPSTALLAALGRPIGYVLYKQPMVGTLLIPISYTLLFHALQHTCSGILNGLGKQTRAAVHFIIGSVIQLACTYFLLANPYIRLFGIIVGFTLSSLVVSILNLVTVLKTAKMSFQFKHWLLKPGFAGLLMGLTTHSIYGVLAGLGTPVVTSIIVSSVLGMFIFLLVLWAVNGLPSRDFFRKHIGE
ncbi:MAG TPA: stage V sporulation protein B [Clostridiales bacterium]|nr:stage V sporulation protein B [Clostridiales bacterium]